MLGLRRTSIAPPMLRCQPRACVEWADGARCGLTLTAVVRCGPV
nr:hypothetical protein RVX_2692 [Nitratidesulfovibrio sp. HK-II]